MIYKYSPKRSKTSFSIQKLKLPVALASLALLVWAFYIFMPSKRDIQLKVLWEKSFQDIKSTLIQYKINPNKFSPEQSKKSDILYIKILSDNGVLVDKKGEITKIFPLPQSNFWEKDLKGQYLIGYNKTGKVIYLYNTRGENVWKLPSLSYPRISPQGKVMLLINGDTSHISLHDINRMPLIRELAFGHILTTYAWSLDGKYLALGFLDGMLVLADTRGRILIKQQMVMPYKKQLILPAKAEKFTVIKGIKFSPDNRFILCHFGLPPKDYLGLYKIDQFETQEANSKGKGPKAAAYVEPFSLIPLDDYNPHEIAMAISPGKKPLIAAMTDQGLVIYNTKGEKMDLAALEARAKKSSFTKERQSEFQSFTKDFIIDEFHYLNFSAKGDLAFLGAKNDGSHVLHIFKGNLPDLIWKDFLVIKGESYVRSFFIDHGENLLLEGEHSIKLVQLYPESKAKTDKL